MPRQSEAPDDKRFLIYNAKMSEFLWTGNRVETQIERIPVPSIRCYRIFYLIQCHIICAHENSRVVGLVVAASTLRRYSFGLRLAIEQADTRPAMPVSFG